MSQTNFMHELNSLNSAMGVNSVTGNKYDYASANVAKKEELTFRKKIRNVVKNFYSSDKDLNLIKSFFAYQSKILLACTKEKRNIQSLSISEIYPKFESLNETEQTAIKARHLKAIKLAYLETKKETKETVSKEKKVIKPKETAKKKEISKEVETEKK
jgi:hypothetical protein